MIQIREIDHIVLRVIELERMLHFYGTVLGCPVEKRQDAIGLVQLRAGASMIDLVPVDGELGGMGGAARTRARAASICRSANCSSSTSPPPTCSTPATARTSKS